MTRKQILLLGFLITTTGLAGPAFALTEAELAASLTAKEAQIDRLRNGEIQQLQLVLTRSGPKEMEPDLLLRLAELYTEKYKLYFFKENEVWTKRMQEYLALTIAQQKLRPRPQLDLESSKKWLGKAVTVLEAIPAQKQPYSRIDEVYYFLGFNQWELGRKDDSIRSFERIISSHPKSKFTAEAHRYVADQAFASRDFTRAARHYELSASRGDSPTRPRVLYGLAWAKFKLHDFSGAVSTMQEAIRLGRANPDAAKAGLALQRDAAESLALFYSEGGDVDNASAFFIDLFGPGEGGIVMRKLSEFYQRQGKYAKALAVNKQLLSLGGAAARQGEEQRFEIMVASLNVAHSKGDRDRHAALLKAMTAEFVVSAKEPAEDKVEILRGQVRKAATLAHREGIKSNRGQAALARAEDLYRLYLSAFAGQLKSSEAAEIHWYLGDVLSQLGKHREAVAEYKLIVDAAEKDAAYRKYQKDASASMVYAMDNYFKAGSSDPRKLDRSGGDQVIASIDQFARNYPSDKDVPKYLARATGILVTGGRMDEARPRLIELTEKHPASKEAWDAAATLLKDAHTRKDADASLALAQRFLANQALMVQDRKGDLRRSLEEIVERSRFEQTRRLEGKDPLAAARRYETEAGSARNSAVRMTSLHNAAVNFGKAGDQASELRVHEQILGLEPGKESSDKAFLAIANEHFLSGRYSEAADVFERFFRVYKPKLTGLKAPQQKEVLESLRSAALLRRALRQPEKSAEDFRELVEAANKGLGPAREAAGEFLFDVARRQRDEGNSPEAIRSFQKYATAFPEGPHAVGSAMESAALYVKLKEEEKAQSYYRTAISKVKAKGLKASPEELGYAARARMELLAPLEEAFEKAPLRLPEARLQADIKAKLQAMERLNKGYVEVVEFGDGYWGVEAYRRMALVYRGFARSLEAAPVPESLSPEDKARFKAQLKSVATPVHVKVAETLDLALQKGEQLQVIGPPMARTYILASVNNARPDRLPLLQALDWGRAADWLLGEQPKDPEALAKARAQLRTKPDDAASWIAIGNHHALQGEDRLAEIFYLQVQQKHPKNAAAANNLGYLRGKQGDLARAMGGFRSALAHDEFSVGAKKNITRLHMSAGLWRHAGLSYKQLEVRAPNDPEVKRGSALAALASGRLGQAEAASSLLKEAGGENARFAEAVLELARGNRDKAADRFGELAPANEYAKLLLELWKTKEAKE